MDNGATGPKSVAYQLEFVQWVPFPLEDVFLFFSDPHNLPRIMPSATGTRIEQLSLVPPPPAPGLNSLRKPETVAGAGSEIVTSFWIAAPLPFRQQWIARITEFEWNHHFCDVQVKGPFASWRHRYELGIEVRNEGSGTVVRDQVEYEIGYSVLGRAAQKLFVEPQMRSTFAHRQKVLEGLLRASQSLRRGA